jgi:hypothetical protein
MKTVFNNSDLAHKYAEQSQNEGRGSGGSFFFRGKVLWSYGSHFPICKFIEDNNGESVLLFTTRSYSNSTAKHISLARNATSHIKKIFCNNPEATHDDNFKAWINSAETSATKLAKAKKPEIYLNELSHTAREANKYAHFFGIVIPENLQTLVDMKDKTEFKEYANKKAEATAKEAQRIMKENKKKFKESFKKWLSCEIDYLYIRLGFDFLRLNDNRVETTQGVKIPIELAKRLYISIKQGTIKEGDKLLNYSVDQIGAQIKIGCHTFKRSYLLEFGSKLA